MGAETRCGDAMLELPFVRSVVLVSSAALLLAVASGALAQAPTTGPAPVPAAASPALDPVAKGLESDRLMRDARDLHTGHESEQALALARQAMVLTPDRLEPQVLVGRLLLQSDSFEEAARVLDAVARVDRNDPMVWVWLGDAQRGLGQLDNAQRSYEQAQRIEPYHRVAGNRLVSMRRSRRADGGRVEPVKQGPPRSEPPSYGIATGLVWVGTLGGLLLLPSELTIAPLFVGIPPAILHMAYGNYAIGLLDLVAIHITAVAGMMLGAAGCFLYVLESENRDTNCEAVVLAVGIFAALGWPIYDATTLSVVPESETKTVARRRWDVSAVPTSQGGALALTVVFW